MASASSSKTVAAPKMPQSRLFESGHMSYAVKGADLVLDESWVSLDTVAGQVALFLVISLTMLTPKGFNSLPKDANVGPVEFDYGIKICQKTKTAKCTLELGPQQYTDPMVTPGAQGFNSVRVMFKCTGPHKRLLEGADDAAARELPLARLCGDALAFEYIRLSVSIEELKPPTTTVLNVLVDHLKTFLTANVSLDIENPWNRILTTNRDARQEPVTSTSASLPLPSSENTPHPQPQALINRPAKAESMSYEAQVARVKSEHEKSIREMKEAQGLRRARVMQELDAKLDAEYAREVEAIKAEFAEKIADLELEYDYHKFVEEASKK